MEILAQIAIFLFVLGFPYLFWRLLNRLDKRDAKLNDIEGYVEHLQNVKKKELPKVRVLKLLKPFFPN